MDNEVCSVGVFIFLLRDVLFTGETIVLSMLSLLPESVCKETPAVSLCADPSHPTLITSNDLH